MVSVSLDMCGMHRVAHSRFMKMTQSLIVHILAWVLGHMEVELLRQLLVILIELP